MVKNLGHSENLSLAEEEGSIAVSLSRENKGCFKRVEGTERERAIRILADEYAA
jgi:hypothetical protein